MIPEAVGHNYSGDHNCPVPFVYQKGNFVWSILLTWAATATHKRDVLNFLNLGVRKLSATARRGPGTISWKTHCRGWCLDEAARCRTRSKRNNIANMRNSAVV
jgi:hypothetical protein